MPPSLIEEDGPSRFDRLLKMNPKFEKCIYIQMRPARQDDDELQYIHYVKSRYKGNNPRKPIKDFYQIRTSRSDFLFDILQNYPETISDVFHRLVEPNYEDKVPFSLHHHLKDQKIRHFMLLHDFLPKKDQEQFLMVELDNKPLKNKLLDHNSFKALCKKLPRLQYYDSFEHFVKDFPFSSDLYNSVATHKPRLLKRKRQFYKKFSF